MTPRRGPMTDNEKVVWMCVLFPIFWPLLPVLLICLAAEGIRDAYWRWRHRRKEHAKGR